MSVVIGVLALIGMAFQVADIIGTIRADRASRKRVWAALERKVAP